MSQLEALLQQCTVKLTLPGRMGWGTGFFVAPGWILTCAHVVQEAKGESVQVWWQQRELEAVVARSLPNPYDLALLQAECPSDVNPPCVYLDQETRSRDPLYLFGYPDEGDSQGEPRTFYCDGITGSKIPTILFNLGQVRPGMSGSPLLNQRTGKVCGIVKFTRQRSSDLGGGAIPTGVIFSQVPELVNQNRQIHQRDNRWTRLLPSSSSQTRLGRQDYKYRQVLLSRVKDWVKGALDNSLHRQIFIELGLEERYDALAHPWEMLWETPTQLRQPLPAGTKVIDKFDDMGAGRSLLILGEPGAGKTTTLAELAKNLIDQAEQDFNQSIPVVFSLSSWHSEKITKTLTQQNSVESFTTWLVAEFQRNYKIPEKWVRSWLENQELLLLLDGLDEVGIGQQDLCVQTLNRFSQKYGQTEIVVCSRVQEYESLSHSLNFQAAIYIQPLTLQQIDQFFADVGSELETVRRLLQIDNILQELAKSPLMLSIISLTYQETSVEDFSLVNSLVENRQNLFDRYIEQMLFRRRLRRSFDPNNQKQKKLDQSYSNQQVKHWMAWLAQRMLQQSQSIFSIEWMQPDLLRTSKSKRRLYASGVRLTALALSLISGFILGLVLQNSGLSRGGLGTGIGLGLAFWFYGLLGYGTGTFSPVNVIVPVGSLKRKGIILLCGATIATVPLLWFALKYRWLQGHEASWAKSTAIFYLIAQGLGAYDIDKFTNFKIGNTLASSDEIKQSSVNITVLISVSTISGILGGGLIFLIFILSHGGLEILGYMWEICNISGWKIDIVREQINEIFLLVFSLLKSPIRFGSGVGFSIGLFCSIATATAFIQHLLLRIILYRSGDIPWNYKNFLEYARERIFLQKIGKGYIFKHRLLLEHFALLERDQSLQNFLLRLEDKRQFRNRKLSNVYARSLELCKEILKERYSDISESLSNLVRLYYEQEQHSRADSKSQKAIDLLQSLVRQDHEDVSNSLNSLGVFYHNQDCHREAESLYLLALQLKKYFEYKTGNRRLAVILENLGDLYYVERRYDEAKPLYLKALRLRKRWLGKKDITVAATLSDLGSVYFAQCQYGKAESFFIKALELRRAVLGEDHLDVADTLINLARIYELQRRFDKAEILYEQAFDIKVRLLGERHSQTVNNLQNLANLYQLQERYSEAESGYLRVIEIRKLLSGEEHPDVALSLNSLAIFYYVRNRCQEAEPLLVQALSILEQQQGEEHPDTTTIRENLNTIRSALPPENC
ncbi:MAG: tetratricopeptide repeat protein [Leptolyngbya sp. BL-A-14]